jgi:hypothetical protein
VFSPLFFLCFFLTLDAIPLPPLPQIPLRSKPSQKTFGVFSFSLASSFSPPPQNPRALHLPRFSLGHTLYTTSASILHSWFPLSVLAVYQKKEKAKNRRFQRKGREVKKKKKTNKAKGTGPVRWPARPHVGGLRSPGAGNSPRLPFSCSRFLSGQRRTPCPTPPHRISPPSTVYTLVPLLLLHSFPATFDCI